MLATAPAAQAGGLHDPTRPDYMHASAGTSDTGWRLNSTLISPSRRLAVVNGKTVSVGDHVGGATVLAIHPGSVKLRTDSGTLTVELISTTIKTAHSAPERR